MPTVPHGSSPSTPPAPPFQPIAAVLAWVLPGLGHLFLGHTRRAVLIAAGTLGLFFSGLLVGGIDCIDRKEDFFWFLGQSLVGPVALGVDHAHQTYFKGLAPASFDNLRTTEDLRRAQRRSAAAGEARIVRETEITDAVSRNRVKVSVPTFRPAGPGESPPNIKSLGRVNELGTLFCTVAGFMNLICIIDAAQLHRRDRRRAAPSGQGVAA